MLESMYSGINWALGLSLDRGDLSLVQMCLRAFLVYIAGIFLTIVNRRFIKISTPFDAIIRFTIGSLVATAIIGGVNFFSTIIIIGFLTFLNLLFAALSFYSSTFESLVSGTSEVIFEDGKIKWASMKKNFITKKHLLATIRKNSSLTDFKQIDSLIFENDGEISVIPKNKN